MGLFDKIKDNAKNISVRAIEATREYEEDYEPQQQTAGSTIEPAAAVAADPPAADDAAVSNPAADEDVEFLIDESSDNAPTEEKSADDKAADKTSEDKPANRKSKVTEISKEEHEKAEKEKRQEKTKKAAKERLAKSYTPSYKKSDDKEADKTSEKSDAKDKKDSAKTDKPAKKASKSVPIGIVDITPKKMPDPLKGAIYARERAALSALASQRKLNGTVALYVAKHMNFKTAVYINRVEYSGSFGKTVLPIDNIAWIKVRHGGTGVILETAEGKRVVMVVKQNDRLPFVDAVMKVQAMQPKRAKFKDTQTVRIDKLEQFGEGIDEIEKLANLYDKGILSHDEFEAKKKQILGL